MEKEHISRDLYAPIVACFMPAPWLTFFLPLFPWKWYFQHFAATSWWLPGPPVVPRLFGNNPELHAVLQGSSTNPWWCLVRKNKNKLTIWKNLKSRHRSEYNNVLMQMEHELSDLSVAGLPGKYFRWIEGNGSGLATWKMGQTFSFRVTIKVRLIAFLVTTVGWRKPKEQKPRDH